MKSSDLERKKRTQRDYTLGFKLAVVSQVEKAILRINKPKNAMEYKEEVQFWFGSENMVT